MGREAMRIMARLRRTISSLLFPTSSKIYLGVLAPWRLFFRPCAHYDLRIHQILEGKDEIMRVIIARAMFPQ
jgi:alkylation response protein AidB-like acyl-CoA dehydrogenase